MPSPLDTLEVSPTQGTTAGKPLDLDALLSLRMMRSRIVFTEDSAGVDPRFWASSLVKPVRTQILAACLEVGSMDVRGPKVPGLVNEGGSKTMGALGTLLCRSRFAFYIFVSEAPVGVEGEGSNEIQGPFWRGKVNGA
jgi:hypothetical protein